jgi:hypothetical protein
MCQLPGHLIFRPFTLSLQTRLHFPQCADNMRCIHPIPLKREATLAVRQSGGVHNRQGLIPVLDLLRFHTPTSFAAAARLSTFRAHLLHHHSWIRTLKLRCCAAARYPRTHESRTPLRICSPASGLFIPFRPTRRTLRRPFAADRSRR